MQPLLGSPAAWRTLGSLSSQRLSCSAAAAGGASDGSAAAAKTPKRKRRIANLGRGPSKKAIQAAAQGAKTLRDPFDMDVVLKKQAEGVSDPRGVFVEKATGMPSVEDRMDAMLDDATPLSSEECLEALSADGEKLTDSQVARLVTHCVASRNRLHGTLTVSMFDVAVNEARDVVESARRLGHEAGPETLSVLVALHANPTEGNARDLDMCLELLRSDEVGEVIRIFDGFAAPWVYEAVLHGCALDDDEETALQLIDEFAPPLSAEAWVFALSSCNKLSTVKRLAAQIEESGMPLSTDHRNAMIKAAAKAKAAPYAEECFVAIPEDERNSETYLAYMHAKAVSCEHKAVQEVFFTLAAQANHDIMKPDVLMSVLQLCLMHAKQKNDAYCKVAARVLDGASAAGLDRDVRILTRAMWVFLQVGDAELVKRLGDRARHMGVALEGHHFEMLRYATNLHLNLTPLSPLTPRSPHKAGTPCCRRQANSHGDDRARACEAQHSLRDYLSKKHQKRWGI